MRCIDTNPTHQVEFKKKVGIMMSKLLDVIEASKRLSVSPNTIRKWVQLKRIPYVKIGTLVRFKEDVIENIAQGGMK